MVQTKYLCTYATKCSTRKNSKNVKNITKPVAEYNYSHKNLQYVKFDYFISLKYE